MQVRQPKDGEDGIVGRSRSGTTVLLGLKSICGQRSRTIDGWNIFVLKANAGAWSADACKLLDDEVRRCRMGSGSNALASVEKLNVEEAVRGIVAGAQRAHEKRGPGGPA
jgi:hypothetical protein